MVVRQAGRGSDDISSHNNDNHLLDETTKTMPHLDSFSLPKMLEDQG